MCKCNPLIRTPFCGKGDCQWPETPRQEGEPLVTGMMTHPEPWPWQPDLCPADQDFIAWAQAENVTDKTILHMGPGAHHEVGKQLSFDPYSNRVIALTIDPEEAAIYSRMVIADPQLGTRYKCLFADIGSTRPDLELPHLDIVTMFHLGEIDGSQRRHYAASDEAVIERYWDWLMPGGKMAFYTGSSAWDRVRGVTRSIYDVSSERSGSLLMLTKHRRGQRRISL